MIEAQVHRQLKALLRREQIAQWPHQLTMARLVARSLATGRSALMQVAGARYEYRLSYLCAALSWPQPVILAVTERVQQELLELLPLLKDQTKPFQLGTAWPDPDWSGVLVVDPVVLLQDRLQGGTKFPTGIPIVFDQAQELEQWVLDAVQITVTTVDWHDWRASLTPQEQRAHQQILQLWVQLTHYVLTRSPALQRWPSRLQHRLRRLIDRLDPQSSLWAALKQGLAQDWTLWAQVRHETGYFTLHCAPHLLSKLLAERLWSQHPVVLIGEHLDPQKQAPSFRERFGLEELTCLQFPPDRHEEEICVYVPPKLADPQAPVFLAQVQPLVAELILRNRGPVVVLVENRDTRHQLGTQLAAQFGSRVGISRIRQEHNDVLVCDWAFWEAHRDQLLPPAALAVCSLPFPSLDHPLVMRYVETLKQERRDWFREYLLPTALGRLQRGVNALRRSRSLVAILDGRLGRRSYGQQFLESLAPIRRITTLSRSELLMP